MIKAVKEVKQREEVADRKIQLFIIIIISCFFYLSDQLFISLNYYYFGDLVLLLYIANYYFYCWICSLYFFVFIIYLI